MAVQLQGNIRPPHLDRSTIPPRTTPAITRITNLYEDVPPPIPLKDAKYRELCGQRSSVNTFDTIVKTNDMPSSEGFYEFQQGINSFRRDSLLDPPFYYNFDPKGDDSISLLVDFDHGSTEALLDSYCSSTSSHSPTSPHQSLLPPLPHHLSSSSQPSAIGEGFCPYQQGPLPATPFGPPFGEKSVQELAFNSPSKRSFTPLQLESLRQCSLSPAQVIRSQTPSPTVGLSSHYTRTVGPAFSPASTTTTSSTLHSTMSSPNTTSLLTTVGSFSSAPKRNASMMRKHNKRRKPAKLVQHGDSPSNNHGLTISSPLETKSSSPVAADFDLGLPSHDFETRRQTPTPPTTDGIAFTPSLPSPCSTSLGTPTTPSSIRPLLPSFHEQSIETSAFDSDTDDEGPSQGGRRVHYKASFARLGTSRSRADTAPAANTRTVSKGAALSKRISKQDIRIPGLLVFNPSKNATAGGCGITTVHTSDSSTTSPVTSQPSRAATPPMTLRKKMSHRESSPPRSKRPSNESRSSKRSGTSSHDKAAPPATLGSSNPAQRERNGSTSSGKKLRSWIARVFGRRNTQ